MKKLYQKFLYIPKHEKVSKKVFLTRTFLSVMSILLCCVCLCSITYAYFTAGVSSYSTSIRTATYDLEIVNDADDTEVPGSFVCSGADDYIYTFKITATGTATTGYCKVMVDGEQSPFFTDQIRQGETLLLKIKAADDTRIAFVSYWGNLAAPDTDITYGGDRVIECTNAQYLMERSDEEEQIETKSTEDPSESESESESEAESESEVESETQTESESETESELETESESETESELETESESETENVTETESESGTESETGTESESVTESETETESESIIENESEIYSENTV